MIWPAVTISNKSILSAYIFLSWSLYGTYFTKLHKSAYLYPSAVFYGHWSERIKIFYWKELHITNFDHIISKAEVVYLLKQKNLILVANPLK